MRCGRDTLSNVSRFLRRQPSMNRRDLDGVAIGEFGEDVDQQAHCRSREFDLMRAILVVENLDALYFRSRGGVSRQRTLPFDSRLHLALHGQDRVRRRRMGHRALRM